MSKRAREPQASLDYSLVVVITGRHGGNLRMTGCREDKMGVLGLPCSFWLGDMLDGIAVASKEYRWRKSYKEK